MKYLVFGLAGLLWALDALSWSTSVHMEIGQAVYDRLSKKEQRYYDRLTAQMPVENLSFYQLSPWVDSIRNEPIWELFEGRVPEALKPYQQRHSSTWHYENSFYFKPKQHYTCALTNNGMLQDAMLAVDASLQGELNKRQEAILVAFAVHLLEDVHQPLHTGTLVRSDCSLDLGGNRYCLQQFAGKCALNLHQLWDQGFGASKGLSRHKHSGQKSAEIFEVEKVLHDVLQEGESHLAHVYAIDEDRLPTETYTERSKSIAGKQLERAVERVSAYLKLHFARVN